MTNNPAIVNILLDQVDVKDISNDIFDAIRQLEYKDKLKAVALNHYLNKKKDQDLLLEEEMKKLQIKYDKLAAPLYLSSNQIIDGSRIPNEMELKDLDSYLNDDEFNMKNQALNSDPIKNYWYRALKNSEIISQEIKEKDELALKFLTKIEYLPDLGENFTLTFHFHPNEFFSNVVLKKHFELLQCENPVRSDGTLIEWKEGMNITKKTVKRKQKNKRTGAVRVIAQEVEAESFFNFFGSINLDEKEEIDNNDQKEMDKQAERMDIDYDLARMIVDEIIPYSLEYYLGVKIDDDNTELDSSFKEDAQDDEENTQPVNKVNKTEKSQCNQQ